MDAPQIIADSLQDLMDALNYGHRAVKAVEDGRVYTMCQTPFSWLDRPPAVNRFIGLQWLTNLLYPEAYDIDIVETTKEFYSLFYHRDLTDDQVQELLGNSYRG